MPDHGRRGKKFAPANPEADSRTALIQETQQDHIRPVLPFESNRGLAEGSVQRRRLSGLSGQERFSKWVQPKKTDSRIDAIGQVRAMWIRPIVPGKIRNSKEQ